LSRQKEYFIVLDTETCNTVEQPLPYDIGWAVCDRKGNIYETRSFVVAETFIGMRDVMKSAYYAEKIPQYWEDIKLNVRTIKSMWDIRKVLLADMKKYKVKKIGAYNMAFDKRALNNLMRYVSKSWCRWFFPFGTEYFCIWSMACQTLLNRTSYIKFALNNGLISTADNVQTSAECCYKYIRDNVDFKESHTGLEDVLIEVEILSECYRQHAKMDTSINTACWRLPQRKRRELDLREVFA
jgi:hypothetical protein